LKTAERIRMTYWMDPKTNGEAIAAAKARDISLTQFITECVEGKLSRMQENRTRTRPPRGTAADKLGDCGY